MKDKILKTLWGCLILGSRDIKAYESAEANLIFAFIDFDEERNQQARSLGIGFRPNLADVGQNKDTMNIIISYSG